ncbi:MAG: hypothetical protein KDD69_15770 [Bdellovibrionales bacterium]|nr:hypothetical protein [Bdellovibrionales bacterium]
MRTLVFLFLLICFLTCLGAIGALAYYGRLPFAVVPPQAEQAPARLVASESSAVPTMPQEDVPVWLVMLTAGFFACQVLPLLVASRKSRKRFPTVTELNEVNFLCETPMYLGLLGSLFGVCMTQFLTGSLAAPLAYLTTISGIILFLLAKYTIALPFGHTVDAHVLSGE